MPPPSIQEGIAVAEQAMVKLTVGTSSWSGVMVDESGLILTTSSPLSTSPLVNFRLFSGVTGQAWVVGRDDALDLALLEIINPAQAYDSVEVALLDPPERSEQLALLHYQPSGVVPNAVTSAVVGSRQDGSTGVEYLQVQGFSSGSEHGGGVFDAAGRLRGLRMNAANMVEIGIGRSGEAWAMNTFGLAASVIPRLQSGYADIRAVAGTCATVGAPPPIPSIMNGDLTIGGADAPAGKRLYARVVKLSGAEVWFSEVTTTPGRYFLAIGICDTTFNGGTVEFWHDASKSPVTTFYVPGEKRIPTITFP